MTNIITICAWCKRRLVDDEWVKDELNDEEHPPFSVSHSLCSDCDKQYFGAELPDSVPSGHTALFGDGFLWENKMETDGSARKMDKTKWREVSKEDFFKDIDWSQNVHPRIINDRYPYSEDWMTSFQVVRGKTVGYYPEGSGLPANRYYLPNDTNKEGR